MTQKRGVIKLAAGKKNTCTVWKIIFRKFR
jgi:hypothetical protein